MDEKKWDISIYGTDEKHSRIVRFFIQFTQNWFSPVIRVFARLGMTGNMFSLLSLLSSLAFPIAIMYSAGLAAAAEGETRFAAGH